MSRRDVLHLAKTCGLTSTLLAASAFTGAVTLPSLAKAAASIHRKRFGEHARFMLGAAPQGLSLATC